MTTHPILGPIAPVESLGRATLEAIESSGGCSIPKVLVDINARAREIDAERPAAPIDLEALRAALATLTNAIDTIDEHRLSGELRNLLIVTLRMDAAEPLRRALSEALAELTTRRARDAEVEVLVAAVRESRAAIQAFADDGQPENWMRYTEAESALDASLAPFTGAKP